MHKNLSIAQVRKWSLQATPTTHCALDSTMLASRTCLFILIEERFAGPPGAQATVAPTVLAPILSRPGLTIDRSTEAATFERQVTQPMENPKLLLGGNP
jgi:hypothetical protein